MTRFFLRNPAVVVAAIFLSALSSPDIARADPIPARSLLVSFTVSGDSLRDPEFGTDTASGAFAFSTRLIPAGGGVVQAPNSEGPGVHFGLGAERIALSWAGTTWSTANADVYRLEFDSQGTLQRWVLGGVNFGSAISFQVSPDFLALPLGGVDDFEYTTPRSLDAGVFRGRIQSWFVTAAPSPVPEPASLLLFGTALLWVRKHARSRHPASPSTAVTQQ